MLLKKEKQTIILKNEIMIEAFKNSGWKEVKEKPKGGE